MFLESEREAQALLFEDSGICYCDQLSPQDFGSYLGCHSLLPGFAQRSRSGRIFVPLWSFQMKLSVQVRIMIIWEIQPNKTPTNACLFKKSFTLREQSPRFSLPYSENIQCQVCWEVLAPYSSPSGPFAVQTGIVQALRSPPVRDRIIYSNISIPN